MFHLHCNAMKLLKIRMEVNQVSLKLAYSQEGSRVPCRQGTEYRVGIRSVGEAWVGFPS